MEQQHPKHLSPWIAWSIVILFFGIGLFATWYYYFQVGVAYDNAFTNTIGLTKKSTTTNADAETYTNSDYKFSMSYPNGWTKTTPASSGSEGVFTVNFADPQREKDREISNCLSNEAVNWTNPNPTKASCQEKLSGLTDQQRKDLNTRLYTNNLYVKVSKAGSSSTITDWLNNRYKIAGGELAEYSPGEKVTLGGISGVVSSTGCCSNFDKSYAVLINNYVYEFGTNNPSGSSDDGNTRGGATKDSFLDKWAATFKFTK